MGSTRYQVYIADFVNDELEIERRVLKDLADVTALNAKSESDLAGRIENADAVLLYHNIEMTEQTIARLKQCKLIVRCGVGIDNVDHAAARRCGIPVVNVPDYGTEEVADSAMGMTLALARGIHQLDRILKGNPEPWSYLPVAPVHRLRGRRFAVVGLGRIGTATALRAKAHGMDVVFYDPYKPDGFDKALGIRRAETLPELLSEALVVSLHCPLTTETRQLIDAESIGLLPSGAFLVNTARGDCVDTRAVLGAIQSGQLGGAGIDVLPQEPPSPDDPLLAAWRDPDHPASQRLILNPHSGFYCEEGLADMRRKGAQACLRAFQNQPLRNVVN